MSLYARQHDCPTCSCHQTIEHGEHDRLPPDVIPKFKILGFDCVCGEHIGLTDVGEFDCTGCGRTWRISCD